MKGVSIITLNFPEPSDDSKKKMKLRDYKGEDKNRVTLADRNPSCRFQPLKLALLIITCCTALTLVYSPISPNDELGQLNFSSRFIDAGRVWQKTLSDPRYVSNLEVDWQPIESMLQNLDGKQQNLRIGLLNFNHTEANSWRQTLPGAEFSVVHLDYANTSITWEVLYPEWIDEEEESEVPACPSLPNPRVKTGSRFDIVAVKLPCQRSEGWSRDVARLHLQLSAAKLAVAGGDPTMYVLFVTECFPIPNLFSCKNLVKHEGNVWLYQADAPTLQQKVLLPIGSCQLAVPLKAEVRPETGAGAREAFATILHSAEVYVCGAIAAARSIRMAGSTRDLVILVDESISDQHRQGLEAAGWKVRTIQRIRNPKAEKHAYNEYNYSKFRLWQLTEYDKVIFIDADLLVLRNIDFLFGMPEIAATGNDATLFNSGVMVVEPSECTFRLLMEHVHEITSYNGGDQGYLNEIFTWWHRVPRHMNYLKHFWEGDTEAIKAKKTRLFAAESPGIYVLHYLGLKPWLCFRDYDCNWNSILYRSFASDEAHATWWRVHDALPEQLQRHCLLETVTKAGLELNRRKAEKANFPDRHWSRNVTDARRYVCAEKYCNWEDVLKHWGQPAPAN